MKPIIKVKIKGMPVLCAVLFFAFGAGLQLAKATTYYSRASANWNVNSTWSTVGYGGAAATNYPKVNDTAMVGDSYTITINTSSACLKLEIGQGTSGIVQYSGAGTYTLAVGGDVIVNAGGSFIYNLNSSKTHILQIGGNFTNNGIVDLFYDVNDIVNITFNTASTSIVSGSGTWELNNVTINKNTSAGIVEVQASAFESAINTLTGTTGTYIHNNSGSYSVNNSSSTDFAINQNMIFNVPQGTMWFSPNSSRTYLYGALYVSGGNVTIGMTSGTIGIKYDQVGAGIPYLEISSGSLTVNGGIGYSSGAGSDPFSFRMTGGTMLLTGGTAAEVFLINDIYSSTFYMSGGAITIQGHNSSPGNNSSDWNICGNTGSVTSLGGTVQFGNNSTPSGTIFDFVPYANVVQPNFKITGDVTASISLQTSKSSTADFKLLSVYIDTNKTFDIQSIQGVSGLTKRMTLTSTFDSVYAFYSKGTFNAQTGIVTLGGTAAQSIGGNSTTTFYHLTINNAAGVTLQHAENVSNLLTMNSGLLNTTATNIITCTSTADASMGSSTSYVNGPMKHTVAVNTTTTRNFPIGKSGAYRPAVLTATHSNNTSVTYTGEMVNTPAKSLNYALPSTVNSVSNTRYWDFKRDSVVNLTSATLTLYYDVDDTVPDRNRVVVVHDDGNDKWVNYGGTGTADTAGSITSQNISSFKTKFSFGYPPAALPVRLISFKAKKSDHTVNCDWETASEINNDFFTVERSLDGIHYIPLTTLKGAGNSTTLLSYHFEDLSPVTGDSYYRLKQTDFDGKFEYADPVHVFFQEYSESYTLFPNPSPGKVHIIKPGDSMEGISAIVQDMNGKQVPVDLYLSPSKNELTVDMSPEASALNDFVVLYLFTPNGTIKEKILVANK